MFTTQRPSQFFHIYSIFSTPHYSLCTLLTPIRTTTEFQAATAWNMFSWYVPNSIGSIRLADFKWIKQMKLTLVACLFDILLLACVHPSLSYHETKRSCSGQIVIEINPLFIGDVECILLSGMQIISKLYMVVSLSEVGGWLSTQSSNGLESVEVLFVCVVVELFLCCPSVVVAYN